MYSHNKRLDTVVYGVPVNIPKWILKATGEIYLHKFPGFFVWKPPHYRVKGEDIAAVQSIVRPGDILLRTYQGYLNTLFTPGDWGHAAIYLGNSKVVHAVGEGVIQEHILTFLRTDAVCVLRTISTMDAKIKAVVRAKEVIGLPYNYAFSAYGGTAKLDALYCSQLVDYAYGGLFKDEYTRRMGHDIICPQQIFDSEHVERMVTCKS